MPGKYDVVQLVKDVQGNKQGALEKLLDGYGSAILGFIRSKNLLNDADSEDIYQNAVIDIWKGIGSYDPAKSSFLGFLLSIADGSIGAYYKEAASEGDKDDGYKYEDGLDFSEPEKEEDEETQPFAEFLPELKGTPDYVVINSPYLYEKYILLIKTLMGEVDPPHLALVYAVLKLASGAAANLKGLEIEDLKDKTLFELLLIFKREYTEASGIPDTNTNDEIMLMFNRLDELTGLRKLGSIKLEELIAKDEEESFDTAVNRKIRESIDGKFLEIFKV